MKMRGSFLMVSLIALTALPAAAFADGTLVASTGSVLLEHQGKQSPASEGTTVQSGDMLIVPKLANVQLRFDDDSIFAIPGKSSFSVDNYAMATPSSGGKALYTLHEGGLRTVTGKISKGEKDEYALHTEEANITVAGSAYSALRCTNQCGQHKPGLYVRGEKGIIIVTNPAGQMRLKIGQVVYVASNSSAPVSVKISPFSDPKIAASLGLGANVEGQVNIPPRIEHEPPASPS